MAKRIAATGNQAVAQAMRQIVPDVVAAYPITPQTDVVEEFSSFVADGLVPTEFVPVESEHSSMSCCIGAAAAGARAMTATSSQGLALMWEMLYIAAGMRLPIVMVNVNRALSAPLNIHGDQSDSMGARDSGWIQLYCKNQQEAYDTAIQAVRIAEHEDVRLPVMVCYDGFIVSHSLTGVDLLDDHQVRAFVGEARPHNPLLDPAHPVTYGPLTLFDYCFEFRRQLADTFYRVPAVIEEVAEEYARLSGRYYGRYEKHCLDDADIAVVALGSAASTAEVVVDDLRAQGVRAGLLRLRSFRPFPKEELARELSHLKALCVLDRADSPGAFGGPVGIEVRSALMESERRPLMINGIYGLGGRDTTDELIASAYRRLEEVARTGQIEEPLFYLGVRGGKGNGGSGKPEAVGKEAGATHIRA
ncbi:MAG: pyruvate ferredoxin oxidoreductase [Chloroflexi bacterium]|nr:pyruvate ferredoxin oxidoreductase [Chloroflexota bacterium]